MSSAVGVEEGPERAIETLPKPGETTCWGRVFSENSCFSEATFYKIAGVVGVLLFLAGVLFLTGYYGPHAGSPATSSLQHLSDWTASFSAKFGTDALTMGVLGCCFGLGIGMGGFGFAVREHQLKAAAAAVAGG